MNNENPQEFDRFQCIYVEKKRDHTYICMVLCVYVQESYEKMYFSILADLEAL